ncbi:MAG: hypothetical protein PVF58_17130 [Candidatus Methanofastidiosia archaeon]|jgi:hypothetical protein
MDFVVDANVLGKACKNNHDAVQVLVKMRNHRVIYCTEILKEYKALPNKNFCKNSNSKLVKEWLIGLANEYGKKIQVDKNINKCFKKLIKRNKFKFKDIIYVNVAENSNDRLLIAFEWHFIQADRCISQLRITRLTLKKALPLMD